MQVKILILILLFSPFSPLFSANIQSNDWMDYVQNEPSLAVINIFEEVSPMEQDGGPIKVVAKSGDGIYSILRDNGYDPGKYLNAFIKLNKSRLGKNNSLIIGKTYILPPKEGAPKKQAPPKVENHLPKPELSAPTKPVQKKGTGEIRTYKIFGKQYEDIEIIDHKLKGAVYYLVAGHGGPDPGAVGKYGKHQLCEDEYAYDVTLRLARELIMHDALVYMIIRDKNDGIRDESFLKCDHDEVCYPKNKIPLNHNKRLAQRKNAVNQLYLKHRGVYQRLVVIHLDSRTQKEKVDVFFYHDKRSKASEKFANNILDTFKEKYEKHQPGRGYRGSVSTRNLFMVRATTPPSTFIELGNIANAGDQKRFIVTANRQALAEWLCEGLMKDFGS